MPTPIPWMIALGAAVLGLAAKGKGAKAEPIEPVEPVTPPEGTPRAPVVTGPAPTPVTIMPVPRTQLPPIIPPDAVEIPPPKLEEITDTSPGQPVQPRPPKAAKPIGGRLPELDEVEEVIEEVLEEIPVGTMPISTMPIDAPTDLGELEEIVLDVPDEVIDIDEVPDGAELLSPTDLAVEVYNITQGGIRNLKGSEVRTIKAYQTEQGLKSDGLYGPNTAESLIQYGFVPSTPWIWPKQNTSQVKADWKQLTRDMATQDPQRADEWAEAGRI